MTAWPELFGDQLATASGGQQTLFPTNEHLGGEQYCVVVVTTYVCPTCPAFMERLRTLKPEMARKGVAIVALYVVDTERQHLQMAEEYGEVQMPIGFPTPPELLEKKRYRSGHNAEDHACVFLGSDSHRTRSSTLRAARSVGRRRVIAASHCYCKRLFGDEKNQDIWL